MENSTVTLNDLPRPHHLANWKDTRVMTFAGQYDTLKHQPGESYQTITIGGILDLVRQPAAAPKEQAPATIGSSYCAHDARCHEVQAQHGRYPLLRFDIDSGNHPIDNVIAAFTMALGDCCVAVYSTSSATPDGRRWRVLGALSEPIGHELRRAAEFAIREDVSLVWGIDCDPALDRPGQHIYLPAVAPNKRRADGAPVYYEWRIVGDAPLTFVGSQLHQQALKVIEAERELDEQRRAAVAERREKDRQRREAKASGGDKALSPIEWFNQNHVLEDVLVEAGYEQSPSNPADWQSPLQTSGTYATRVYGDYFVTLSATDAEAGLGTETRNGARCGDPFAVFLQFMHGGDRNSALAEIRARRDFAAPSQQTPAADSGLPAIRPITVEELNAAKLTPRVILPETLYADVRLRIAAGGSSKTTLSIFEAANLALARKLWGQQPAGPVRTVFITREDSREILVARIRAVMEAMMLSVEDIAAVLENVAVLDYTDFAFRLTAIQNDAVVPHRQNLTQLVSVLRDWRPDWLICDPLVSFGVGEARVNDSEQGLIEAFRMLRNELGCCVEGIHHTGKAVARDKIIDQYAGRGGSALADGARMVVVMQPLAGKDWTKHTGGLLTERESGFVMAFPKLSYCSPRPPVFFKRSGYRFQQVDGVLDQAPDKVLEGVADRLHEFLLAEAAAGRAYSRTELDACTQKLGVTRMELRNACSTLQTAGRVVYHDVRGKTGSHYVALSIAPNDAEFLA